MLAKDFDVKDEGEIHYILGLKISRDRVRRTMYVSQTAYLEQILREFESVDCDPMAAPTMELQNEEQREKTTLLDAGMASLYRSGIGKLNWAVRGTRPDLAYTLSVLAMKLQDPNVVDWQNLKRIMRYLRATTDVGIELGAGDLIGYSDADHNSTPGTKGKSYSGYVFKMGGPISWSSKRQEVCALSTTEAELIALVHAAKEGRWLAGLARSMGMDTPSTIVLYCDNQSTIKISEKSDTFHARTKHIDYRYHWIKDSIASKEFEIRYVCSADQCADVLTKLLQPKLHWHSLEINQMISVNASSHGKMMKGKRLTSSRTSTAGVGTPEEEKE